MFRGLVVALGMVIATRADARPVRLDIEVDACPDLATKVRAVAPFEETAAARVAIIERARVATIVLDDGQGHALGPRVVEAATCSELATSVAVIVAMSLPAITAGPDAPVEPPPSEPAPAPIERSTPAPEVAVHAPVVTEPARGAIGASLAMSSALGEVVAVGARWNSGPFSIGGELAAAWLPEVDVMPGAHVDVSRYTAAAVPCAHHGSLGLCGVVRAGFDRGRGAGLMDARTVELPVLELGGRVIWERPVTERFALQLHGELAASMTSSELTVDHAAVWHSSRYEALAGATVLVRFP